MKSKNRVKKFKPSYLYTNKNSPVRFSTSNKIIKYIKQATKKNSKFQKKVLTDWKKYSRKIIVGTHTEKHFNKKRQYHFYHYGNKNSLFAVDLCDLFGSERDRISLQNSGYKYFFMLINCLTKYLVVIPIKSKKGSEILTAFKKWAESLDLKCSSEGWLTCIHVDQEFVQKKIKDFCKKHCLNIYFSQGDHKSSIIERAVRTFKNMMVKRMEANRSEKWDKWLKSLINQYNNETIHSSIRMTPKDAETYPSFAFIRLVEKYNKNAHIQHFNFKIGEWVRLKIYKSNIFRKGYLRKFTAQIYKIIYRRHVNNTNFYYLENYKGERMKGGFNEELLTLAEKDDDFAVEVLKTDNNRVYVHYDGFNSSDDEWIPKNQLID